MKPSTALHSFMLAGTLLGATGSLHAQTTFYWDAARTEPNFSALRTNRDQQFPGSQTSRPTP